MKTKSKINGYIIRSAVYAVFLSVGFIALEGLGRLRQIFLELWPPNLGEEW